ncbi:MAG: zf-HC2 domain-containing protein [Actinomycetota bacterium]|nr:zf-HC2 domain-containing protein [Actinomycetota bacterium]
MNCTVVREALPEFALGVPGQDDTSSIELHVETCAACRKEAIDLQRAASTFGYALAPLESPEPELEDRVVGAVQAMARPSSRSGGRSRRAGVALLAAAIVVAGIGVGSVFAGRAAQQRVQAEQRQIETRRWVDRFGPVLADSQLDPDAQLLVGMLAARSGPGTGSALTIVSPSVPDKMLVIVNDVGDDALPLTVSITDTKGHVFEVGTIKRLDTAGGAKFASIVGGSLKGFVDVVVRDAKGHIALRGTLSAQTAVASPTP